MATAPVDPAVLAELSAIVGPSHLLVDPDLRAAYETDWTGRFQGRAPAVALPASTPEVEAIATACRLHGVALVPQGGNTGLVGGSVPLDGEVVLNLTRMATIEPVDEAAGQLTAGAGAVLADVQAAAGRAGLRYAVDFAARGSATVGGSVASNAGGLNVLRHGATREQLLGVEAVLGRGETVEHLHGLIKDNTGYHLPGLLCGSEGTLAIVTRARLRLIPRHERRVVALVALGTPQQAVETVAAARAGTETLEAAELFLDEGLALVCEAFGLRPPFDRPHAVYVLLEAAAHHDPTDELAAALAAGPAPEDVAVATDPARQGALWRYREDHTLAINTLGAPHKLDVTLPAGTLAEFIGEVPGRVREVRPEARTWLFGHAGDGNIHVNVTGVAPDDDAVDEVVLRLAAGMGGSISAEHGIGTAKRPWLHLNRSPAEIRAMRAIKAALDPDGILNPNVLLP